MASDSRTNAGYDQVNVCRKMHTFAQPGERVFVVLASGSLSLHAVDHHAAAARFRRRPGAGRRRRCTTRPGSSASRSAGSRRSTARRSSGTIQVQRPPPARRAGPRASRPDLYLIYPQGNPLQATEDSPYPADRRDASTAGRSSTAASASTARRWRRRRSTRCCRSTRR